MAIRIGIAGFGSHALGRMLPVIAADARLHLVAVWSRNDASQVSLRERGIAGVTGDFAQFLATPMDVAYVASPTGLHADHTTAILKAGLHAWVEKPLATSLEETRQLVTLAETGARMLTEAFMFPWHAQAAAIQQTLAAGSIGKLRHVALTFCFPHLAPDNFRYDPALGGGAFLDHACYLAKALDSYVGGPWTVLGGCIEHAHYAVDISGAALLRRDTDGVIANLNWGFGSTYVNEIQFVGENGRLLVESAFTKPASRACDLCVEDNQGKQSILEIARENPYSSMIDGFIKQFEKPESWQRIREDILQHAQHYFALQAALKQCNAPGPFG